MGMAELILYAMVQGQAKVRRPMKLIFVSGIMNRDHIDPVLTFGREDSERSSRQA